MIVVFGFCFGGWDASEAVHEALLVVPGYVVGGEVFDVAEGVQGAIAKRRIGPDALVLVEPDRGLGQRIVVGVANAADRRSETRKAQCFAESHTGVLTRFKRWMQHLDMEVFSMGRPPGWAAALTGRAVMRSPGRPPVRRDLERAFWGKIAEGLTSEDAAMACGVSGPVGSRWFRHAGGMPPIELSPVSGRYLCFSEREQIAVMRAEGVSMRMIADRLGRSPSTISRELRRNAATRNGKLEYRASTAQWKADLAARRPKPAKLAVHSPASRVCAGQAVRGGP